MKKLAAFLSIVMILVLMAGLLPTGSALAKKDPGSINLVIHNRTGGKVNLDLVDPEGVHHQVTLPTGLTILPLAQGWYDYFAGLPCGDKSGNFQLNVSKELYFSCGKGVNIEMYNFSRHSPEPVCVAPMPFGPVGLGVPEVVHLCCPPLLDRPSTPLGFFFCLVS